MERSYSRYSSVVLEWRNRFRLGKRYSMTGFPRLCLESPDSPTPINGVIGSCEIGRKGINIYKDGIVASTVFKDPVEAVRRLMNWCLLIRRLQWSSSSVLASIRKPATITLVQSWKEGFSFTYWESFDFARRRRR